ncbi:MAG: hypothetical protein K0S08_1366 [Gammaproteobacteria bacterium]|jgi:hypothetical protein|nr:hypothetical protein [Gammaproteobacteria bacterium]
MLIKIIILLFLAVILFCLGSALYYLLSGKGDSRQMVKALTARITLSLILFFLLIIGFATGVIHPHPFQMFVPVTQQQA